MQSSAFNSTSDAQRSRDKRLKYLDREMAKHNYSSDGLLEVLYTANDLFGYLSKDILRYIARSLKLPPSKVYSVATYYSSLHLEPKEQPSITLCSGPACYLAGSSSLSNELETALPDAEKGYTRCRGLCNHAPVVHTPKKSILSASASSILEVYKPISGAKK